MEKRNLKEEFDKAVVPSTEEFNGEYNVVMLSGIFSWLNILRDKKFFYKRQGHNIALGKFKWGNFIVNPYPKSILIDYDVRKNLFTHNFRDYVKRLPDGSYLGKLYWGERFFLGYFSLKKNDEIK